MDLLRRSNIEIDNVSCGELPTSMESRSLTLTAASTCKDLVPTDSNPNADMSVIKVAMVSMKSQNWSK